MLTALIVDDEAPARDLLGDLLRETEAARVLGAAASGAEALRMAEELRPDVVLLDIQMPGESGLQVAERLAALPSPPRVVFVTAYDEYAVRAFELEAVDYLLKPVASERLRRALQRIERARDDAGDALRRVLERLRPAGVQRLALLDDASGVRHLVSLADIAWFTSRDERTYAQVKGRTLRSMETLAALEEKLAPERFVRTHRAYLVNLAHIREVVPWASGAFNLRLHGCAEEIPLSRNYAPAFKSRTGWT